MATKAADVTEIKFYDVNDVMRLTGKKKTVAYQLIKKINAQQAKLGKMVLTGKVNAAVFNAMF